MPGKIRNMVLCALAIGSICQFRDINCSYFGKDFLGFFVVIQSSNNDDPVAIVPQVGSIMRKYGKKVEKQSKWEPAAKLQDIWLSGPARTKNPVPPNVYDFSVTALPDLTGITIDWILDKDVDTDKRATKRFADLQTKLSNDSSGLMKAEIIKQANVLFAQTSANTVTLGNLRWSALTDFKAFHAQSVQHTKVEYDQQTPLDPLLGALGTFNFSAIPIGSARKRQDGEVEVSISKFLIYVIDSFDFQDDSGWQSIFSQPLGYWKSPDVLSGNSKDGTLIQNKHYRAFRSNSGTPGIGRDFLVVTDTKEVPISFQFEFTPEVTPNGIWTSSDPQKRFRLAIAGKSVQWTETGLETGKIYSDSLMISQHGDILRLERPNKNDDVLIMLGFGDASLRQTILAHDPHPSYLQLKVTKDKLVGTWSGIRVQKTTQGAFKALIQPEDPSNQPISYTFSRDN